MKKLIRYILFKWNWLVKNKIIVDENKSLKEAINESNNGDFIIIKPRSKPKVKKNKK